ncbi:MAG: endonuclease/exonuclease/phosphatase family protein, partial [Planctomycetota bacterium]
MHRIVITIVLLASLCFVGVSAASALELKAADVASEKGDGPDKKANTADDTWQFWFQYDNRNGYGRLGVYHTDPGAVPDSKGVGGWIYSLTEDWSPSFEGVWGNPKTGAIHMHPYTHHGKHASVAITYKVPETSVYKISGGVTDVNVHGRDGITWIVETVQDGKAAKGKVLGKGGPIGDKAELKSAEFKIENACLEKGELVRFVIDPNNWWGSDMTRIDYFKIEPLDVVRLKVSDVLNAEGDGPDGKGNTADDTWQFWFQIIHDRNEYRRLDIATAAMPDEQKEKGIPRKVWGPVGSETPNPDATEGWIYHSDWDGKSEGVWGDAKAGQVIVKPYQEKADGGALAVTYKVPGEGTYIVFGRATDMKVDKDGKKATGVKVSVDVTQARDGKGIGKAQRVLVEPRAVGDAAGPATLAFSSGKVALRKGELVRLVIDPNKWAAGDMTRIDYFMIAPVPQGVRVAAYNVQFGKWCTPEQVGEMFKEYDLDIIAFGEVPAGDWTARVGKVLGMEHCYVGKHTPYNYKDKYKSVLSRTPLADMKEHHLGHGWSTVVAKTTVRGVPLTVYSLHIGGTEEEGCQRQIAKNILPKDDSENIVMMGDFNAVLGKDRHKRKHAPMKWLLDA